MTASVKPMPETVPGKIAASIGLRAGDDGIDCIVAKKDIKKDSELMSFSIDQMLVTKSTGTSARKGADELSDPAEIAVALLNGLYGAQADDVPEELRAIFEEARTAPQLNHSYLWSDEEQEILAGSVLLDRTKEVLDGIENEWASARKLVNASVTLDQYTWALAYISSYGVEMEAKIGLGLPPLATRLASAKHTEEPNVKYLGISGGFFGKSRVILVATKDIKAGDALQCRRLAPDSTCQDALLDFGYVPLADGRCAIAPCVELGFSLSSMDPFYEDKQDILEINKESETPLFLLPNESTRGTWLPPDGMEQFLRLLCLSTSDAFLLEAVFRSDVWDFMALPVSQDNEVTMCDAVIAACEDAIENYQVSGFDEGESGQSTLSSERAKIARAVIAGEKAVLRLCLEHFEREKSNVDAKEYYQERRLNSLDLLRPLDESEIVDAEAGPRMTRSFDDNYY